MPLLWPAEVKLGGRVRVVSAKQFVALLGSIDSDVM